MTHRITRFGRDASADAIEDDDSANAINDDVSDNTINVDESSNYTSMSTNLLIRSKVLLVLATTRQWNS
ncbi:hypothetical protein [Candidatus Epulonipiscium viviparus]|uniref:hypothetical protein n=1 Tax=Candidatus Epulonipiscium viviparus TaxID=420336 RepID=UPI0027380466|nr:hypothetical protein [Candidatus Epulopiscium viviparus]